MKGKWLSFVTACALLAAWGATVQADPTPPATLWARQFGTSATDSARDIAVDGSGNVYITGNTRGDLGGPNQGDDDAFIVKYDSSGTVQWTRQIGTAGHDYAYGIAVDGSGNSYIAGQTSGSLGGPNPGWRYFQDAFIAKWDTGGTMQWVSQIGTTAQDGARAVAVDDSGNSYITGWTEGDLGGPNHGYKDAFITKFDGAGTVQWTRQIGSSIGDTATGVALAGSGDIYVAGCTGGELGGVNQGATDAFILKCDSGGTVHWIRQIGSSTLDGASGIALDSSGNSYITGDTKGDLAGPNQGEYDAFIVSCDSAGTVQWMRQLGTSEYDLPSGIAVDGCGNIYIAGWTEGDLGGVIQGREDAFIVGCDSGGTVQWMRQIGTSYQDRAHGIAVDGGGNSYITGQTHGDLGGPNQGVADAFIMAIGSTPASFGDATLDGCVDGLDYVLWSNNYQTGTWWAQGDFSGDGIVDGLDYILWSSNYKVSCPSAGQVPEPGVLALLAVGGLALLCRKRGYGGRTPLRRRSLRVSASGPKTAQVSRRRAGREMDTSGQMKGKWIGFVTACALLAAWGATVQADPTPPVTLWTRQFGTIANDEPMGIALDASGNIYITGHTKGDLGGPNQGDYDVFTAKYGSAGTAQWVRQFGTGAEDQAFGIAVDGSGNSYVTGHTDGDLGGPNEGWCDAFIVSCDSAGTVQWTRQIGAEGEDRGRGIALDAGGNIYIAGWKSGDLGGENQGLTDALTVKCDSTGTPLWTRQIGTTGYDYAYGIAVDDSGNSYITGYTEDDLAGPNQGGYDSFIIKYDSAGTLQWATPIGTSKSDQAQAIALDGSGNSYIAGFTYVDLGGPVQKYADGFVTACDSSGTVRWTRQIATDGWDVATGIAVDEGGNVYVTGYTDGEVGGPNEWGIGEAFIVAYDSTGTVQSARQFGSGYWDIAHDIAVDGSGNIYVTGNTYGNLGGPNQGKLDSFIVAIGSTPASFGDATLDGCVDGLDYVVWSNNYQTGTWWVQGDFSDDGVVDGLDYVLWSNNYLQGCPGQVPEPTVLSLLALGFLALRRRSGG